MSKSQEVQEMYTDALLQKQGVTGTAIGKKWINGQETDEDAILIFVQDKQPADQIVSKSTLPQFSERDLIPTEIDGIRTDVIAVGRIVKHIGFKERMRPVKPGYSVGHGKITAGTIGGIFIDQDGDVVILSNNHVLANENSAKNGDLIYQPGPADSSSNRRITGWADPVSRLPYVATLKKFMRMGKKGNTHDSAIAKIHPKMLSEKMVNDLYPSINNRLMGFGVPQVGMKVQKCGRTTGHTTGKIIGINASFDVDFDFGNARFEKCVVTTAMSQGGDSGSIIQSMDGKAVALLFAGSDQVTLANPMQIVRDYYGLELFSAQSDIAETVAMDRGWIEMKSSEATVNVENDKVKVTAPANHHCCLELPIRTFKNVECTIDIGSDKGATWGSGLSVHWNSGSIKINLRSDGTFGGYVNGAYNIGTGKVTPNSTYQLRIRVSGQSLLGEIKDNIKWHTLVQTPIKTFSRRPTAIRIGKTDLFANPINHTDSGDVGESVFSNFVYNE